MKTINDNNHTPIEYLGSPKNNKKVECIIIKDREKKRNFSFLFIRAAKNKFKSVTINHISYDFI